VTWQLLHRADVVPALQQMRGERMAQRMRAHWLENSRSPDSDLHLAVEHRLVQMMASNHAVGRIDGALA